MENKETTKGTETIMENKETNEMTEMPAAYSNDECMAARLDIISVLKVTNKIEELRVWPNTPEGATAAHAVFGEACKRTGTDLEDATTGSEFAEVAYQVVEDGVQLCLVAETRVEPSGEPAAPVAPLNVVALVELLDGNVRTVSAWPNEPKGHEMAKVIFEELLEMAVDEEDKEEARAKGSLSGSVQFCCSHTLDAFICTSKV